MTAVSPKPLSKYPLLVRLIFWKQKRTYGRVLDAGLVWGRSPKVFAAVALLFGALDRRSSPLPPALRSLIMVRVSQLNGCAFCVDINSATLLKRGAPTEKAIALQSWRASASFTAEERLALEYAEAMTLPSPGVTAELRERVKAHWGEDALVELTGLIAFQNLSSKFNAALDIAAQGFCALPGLHPTPSGAAGEAGEGPGSAAIRRP